MIYFALLHVLWFFRRKMLLSQFSDVYLGSWTTQKFICVQKKREKEWGKKKKAKRERKKKKKEIFVSCSCRLFVCATYSSFSQFLHGYLYLFVMFQESWLCSRGVMCDVPFSMKKQTSELFSLMLIAPETYPSFLAFSFPSFFHLSFLYFFL